MKNPNWGLVLGLLLASTDTSAQGVIISTVRIDTGSCAPAASTGGLPSNGGVGGGQGASGLPGSSVGGGDGTVNGAGASGVPILSGGNGVIPVPSFTKAPLATSIVEGSGTGSPLPSGVKSSVGSNSKTGPYNFAGFYSLPATGSLLNGPTTTNMSRISGYMTLESCAYYCQASPYFSVEEGYICRCGTVAPTTTLVNNPPMLVACTGDPTEICGAMGSGVVYRGSPHPDSVVHGTLPAEITVPATTPIGSITMINQVTTTHSLGSTTAETATAISSGPAQGVASVVPPVATNLLGSSMLGPSTALTSAAAGNAEATTPTVVMSSPAASVAAVSTPEISLPIIPTAAGPSSSISSSIPLPMIPTAFGPSSTAAVVASSTAMPEQSTLMAPAGPPSTAVASLPPSSLPAFQPPAASAAATTTTSAVDTGAAEPTLIAVPSCPASGPNANNTRYVDLFDSTYDIRCGIDVVGSQRTTAHADTFLRCLQYCDLLNGCIGVTYVDTINQFNNNTNCNSYYSFEGYKPIGGPVDGDFYSGVNVHGPSKGAIDPSSGESTNEDFCADPVTEDYGPDVYGTCYQIGCNQTIGQSAKGVPLAPTVLSSLLGCSLYCSFYNYCVSVTWQGPFVAGQDTINCFPKSSYNTTVATAETGTSFAFNGKCPGA